MKAIAFDLMEWAEIMVALKLYRKSIDASKAINSYFDVTQIMIRIDKEMGGNGKIEELINGR